MAARFLMRQLDESQELYKTLHAAITAIISEGLSVNVIRVVLERSVHIFRRLLCLPIYDLSFHGSVAREVTIVRRFIVPWRMTNLDNQVSFINCKA